MKDLSLLELVKDYNAAVTEKALEKARKKTEGYEFFIELFSQSGGYEEIQIEGFENCYSLFNQYRKIGHDLRLNKVVISGKNGLIKRVTFKY